MSVVQPPVDFEAARQRVHVYLDPDIEYEWISVRKRSLVPRDACCIVLCGQTGKRAATVRCLAFAHEDNGRLHWFGITTPTHEPQELYGVTAFILVAGVASLLFS